MLHRQSSACTGQSHSDFIARCRQLAPELAPSRARFRPAVVGLGDVVLHDGPVSHLGRAVVGSISVRSRLSLSDLRRPIPLHTSAGIDMDPLRHSPASEAIEPRFLLFSLQLTRDTWCAAPGRTVFRHRSQTLTEGGSQWHSQAAKEGVKGLDACWRSACRSRPPNASAWPGRACRIVSRSVRRCQNLAFKLCGGKRLRIREGGWRYRETMMTSSLIVAAGTGVRYPAVQRNTPFHS